MSAPPILIEARGPVHWVTLNRPDMLNALDEDGTAALRTYFRERIEDDSCRAIVLAGAGRGFCAGFDLAGGHLGRVLSGIAGGRKVQREFREIIVAMRRCPQPIVAAVRGPAVGAGLSLALAADIRICSETARMSAAFIKVGLSGGDMGSSYFLPRLIGASLATEMLLTGRTVAAQEARAMGLVSTVVPDTELETTVAGQADRLLESGPLGLALTKEVLNANLDAPSLEAALALEDRTQVLLGQTADFRNAAAAFREKRAPRFEGC